MIQAGFSDAQPNTTLGAGLLPTGTLVTARRYRQVDAPDATKHSTKAGNRLISSTETVSRLHIVGGNLCEERFAKRWQSAAVVSLENAGVPTPEKVKAEVA